MKTTNKKYEPFSIPDPFELIHQVRCIKCRGLLSVNGVHINLSPCNSKAHQISPVSTSTTHWQFSYTGWDSPYFS